MKAPNGEPTNLTEWQWIQVRTPSFKKWFGDWEGAEKSRMVENLVPFQLDGTPIVKDKAALEDVFRSFGVVKNVTDEKYVNFPVGMAGKICAHRGFDQLQVAANYNKLFETAVPMHFEKEQIRDGHKRHPETAGYHHYINTFRYGDKQYYVRFTVKEQKTKPGRENLYYTHSAFISDVEIYKKGADYSTGGRVMNPVLMEVSTPSDDILSKWLGEVKKSKEEASKVVDENGEPLVVYHGTRAKITEFDTDKRERDLGYFGTGAYFSNNRQIAGSYGKNIISSFLNLQNPKIVEVGSFIDY